MTWIPSANINSILSILLHLNLPSVLQIQWKQQKHVFQGERKNKWYIENSANEFLNLC